MLKVHSFKIFVSYFILISKTYNGYVFSVENELEMVNQIDWLFPTRHKSFKNFPSFPQTRVLQKGSHWISML